MASLKRDIGTAPEALPGTVAGTKYAVQNQSVGQKLNIATAANAGAIDGAFTVKPGYVGYPTPEAGESIFVWFSARAGRIAYDKAG